MNALVFFFCIFCGAFDGHFSVLHGGTTQDLITKRVAQKKLHLDG